jgi:hypothetical protein
MEGQTTLGFNASGASSPGTRRRFISSDPEDALRGLDPVAGVIALAYRRPSFRAIRLN